MLLGRYGKLLVVCGLLGLFVGCGGKTENTGVESKKAEEKFVTGAASNVTDPNIKAQMEASKKFNESQTK